MFGFTQLSNLTIIISCFNNQQCNMCDLLMYSNANDLSESIGLNYYGDSSGIQKQYSTIKKPS